jgi:hypothetical protein
MNAPFYHNVTKMDDQSDENCLKIVTDYGWNLKYVKNPTDKMLQIVIDKNGLILCQKAILYGVCDHKETIVNALEQQIRKKYGAIGTWA